MPEPTDRQLLATVARPKSASIEAVRQAIEMLYDRHAPSLLAFAARQIGDAAAAEDILQDVFVTVARKSGAFLGGGRSGESARGWLLAIAGNRVRDLRRKSQRRRRREATVARSEVVDSGEPAWLVRDELDQRLAVLAVDQRLAVELRLRDRLPYTEVAAALGVSLRTAKNRVADGLARLREARG